MKRKTKYKGVQDPGKVPNTRTDNSEIEPAYVRKLIRRERITETAIQLSLFGNPYDPSHEI